MNALEFKHNEEVYSIKHKCFGVYKGCYEEKNMFSSSTYLVHQILLEGEIFNTDHIDGEFREGRAQRLGLI